MCPGVPYALAAKIAYPDRPVIACLGDGAMQMLGINALIDIAKYAERWTDQQLVVVVLNNNDLNQVTWEQRVMSGDPKLEASQVLPGLPLRALRRAARPARHPRGRRPSRSRPRWDEALAADRPVVLEAITDPEVPPLPPHIKLEQAKSIAEALAQGRPGRGRIIAPVGQGARSRSSSNRA